MRITYYHRKPFNGQYSIERVFSDVRSALPKHVDYSIVISRFESKGFWKRIYNIIEASFRQGDVNHVTGDVHYLTYLLHKRTILTIHDCVSLRRLKGLRKRLFFFLWYWFPGKQVRFITTISRATKKELLNYLQCNPEKIVVIPDPVSPFFKPFPFVFNVKKPTILQVGTGHNKNLERVAQALKGISCHLKIVGRVTIEQDVVLRENKIEYSTVSDVSDKELVEIYKQCDMVVFASTYEGFGLPIVEAQATGRPVVTSNILSMPEVAGGAACLVDPFDVYTIREGILKLLEDANYRDELIERGFENVKRFAPAVIAGKYLELYRELYSGIGK